MYILKINEIAWSDPMPLT